MQGNGYSDRLERLRVRNGDPQCVMPPSSTSPRPTSRPNAFAWAGTLALWSLIAATTWAVAVYATVWLVPPYLALMAFVLGVPLDALRPRRGQPIEAPTSLQVVSEESETLENATSASFTLATDSEAAPESAPEPVALKTRRGKGRGASRRRPPRHPPRPNRRSRTGCVSGLINSFALMHRRRMKRLPPRRWRPPRSKNRNL